MESKVNKKSYRKLPRFVWGILLCFLMVYSSPYVLGRGEEKFIRVAILKNVNNFVISVRGKYTIIDPKTQEVLSHGRRLSRSRVILRDGGIHIGLSFYARKELRLLLQKDATLERTGKKKRYRGAIDISVNKKGQLLVINAVELEAYIRGVLYHEVSHRWPLEAIKAQAVAARTYALYQAEVNKEGPYDVTSDIYSQVYGGRSAERYRTNMAAERTKGQVLLYNGKILPAYFHASCGGHTENVKELWKHDLAPLRGQKCVYCQLTPHYAWKKNFQSKSVQDKLNKHGYTLELIKEIRILSRAKSGRIKDLQITTRDGKTVTLAGKTFRHIIGPNELKSNFYDIEMNGYYFDVHGHGWGHGVGMCQWGAYAMSQQRKNYKEILTYYYPGVKITSWK